MAHLLRPGTRLRQMAVRGRSLSSAAWTPAKLSGLLVWYTAGPTWCFSDAGGTTPCGVGDPVYVWKTRAGTSHTLSQATEASRPALQQTAGGKYYVSFDGTDDSLTTLTAISPKAIGVAVNQAVASAFQTVVGVVGNDQQLRKLSAAAWSNNDANGDFFLQANAYVNGANTNASGGAGVNERVIGSRAVAYSWLAGMNLGKWGSGAGRLWNGRMYGIVLSSVSFTADEVSSLDSYLRSLM